MHGSMQSQCTHKTAREALVVRGSALPTNVAAASAVNGKWCPAQGSLSNEHSRRRRSEERPSEYFVNRGRVSPRLAHATEGHLFQPVEGAPRRRAAPGSQPIGGAVRFGYARAFRTQYIAVSNNRVSPSNESGSVMLVINSAKQDAVAAVKEFTKGGAEFVIDAVGVDATRRAGVSA